MANPVDFNEFEATRLIISNNNNNIATILVLVVALPVITSMFINRQVNGLLHCIIQKYRDLDLGTIMQERLTEVEEEESVELDCVVCLCQVTRGEKYKFLPNCNHGFHARCIDAWLQRHSTCPLCRSPVPEKSKSIHYFSVITEDVQVFDVFFSHLLRLLDHFRAWLVDPISPQMALDLGQNCLSFT
ncbi:hypothetical protein Pfo_012348 [Paulownia fortunei]|nr:hypothetical protein Pfo_012348 [Paulownia fortunei]